MVSNALKDNRYLNIISPMTENIFTKLESQGTISSKDFSLMLYGLQGNTGYGEMNTKLLAPIPQLLAMCNDDIQSRDESTALYRL